MKPIRVYRVSVDGYGSQLYSARRPSKAMARAYRDFLVCCEISFKDFLRRAYLQREAVEPAGHGERITVAGLPATRVYHPCAGHYVWFMRDDSDDILCSHPADVAKLAT